jgi:hypothetical protein
LFAHPDNEQRTTANDAAVICLSSGSAVLACSVNLILIPLTAAGLTHAFPQLLPQAMMLAAALALLTSVAWLFRPPAGAVMQLLLGVLVAAILVPMHGATFSMPHTPFRWMLTLVLMAPLAFSLVAAKVTILRR